MEMVCEMGASNGCGGRAERAGRVRARIVAPCHGPSQTIGLAVTRGCGGVKKFFRINSRKIGPAANRRGRDANGPSAI